MRPPFRDLCGRPAADSRGVCCAERPQGVADNCHLGISNPVDRLTASRVIGVAAMTGSSGRTAARLSGSIASRVRDTCAAAATSPFRKLGRSVTLPTASSAGHSVRSR